MVSDPRRLWSVTSLAGEGYPKPALIGWAARVVAERAIDRRATLDTMLKEGGRDEAVKFLTDARWEKSGTAAKRGTELHAHAERLALGLPDETITPEVIPYVEQYRRFLDEHAPTFLMAEAPVYNLTLGYAGTLDAIVELDGVDGAFVLDAKTSDKPADANSTPPYPDIALQLVAYARAELVGVSPADQRYFNGRRYYVYDPALEYVPVPETVGGLALAVFPDRYTLTPVRLDDEVWDSFLAVVDVARFALDVSKRVLGPPITATRGGTA